MQRRELSKALFATAAGVGLIANRAQAQTCYVPCYPQTQAEAEAAVTPTDLSFPPGNVLRYGVDPGGVADATAGIQRAINAGWASGYHAHPWNGQGGATPVILFPP